MAITKDILCAALMSSKEYSSFSLSKLMKNKKNDLIEMYEKIGGNLNNLDTKNKMVEVISMTDNTKNFGMTFSKNNYDDYNENKDKAIFEDVIDNLMIDEIILKDISYKDDNGILHTFKVGTEEHKSYSIGLKNEILNAESKEFKRTIILNFLSEQNDVYTRIEKIIEKRESKFSYIKNIIKELREYVKFGEVEKKKYGEVMTPLTLVKEMIDSLPNENWSNPNIKILDPCNGCGPFPAYVIFRLMDGLKEWQPDEDLRYKHIIENIIYVSELQPKNMFLWLFTIDPRDELKTNIFCGSFLDEGFDYHMKNIWNVEKFDLILANPPYQSYTHLKFFNKSIDLIKDNKYLLFLHPSQVFLDIKKKKNNIEEEKILQNVQMFNTKLTLINGNFIFDVEMFFTPLSITFLKKEKRNSEFEVLFREKNIKFNFPSIKEVNLLGYSPEYQSLKSKIENLVKKNGNISEISKRNGNFYVGISEIRGHACKFNLFKSDFYTILPINYTYKNNPESKHFNAGFETEKEAKNFIKFLETKFARFCLSLLKINSTLAGTSTVINLIPLMDFNIEYNDEVLKSIIPLSNEEWNFILNTIPNFYKNDVLIN